MTGIEAVVARITDDAQKRAELIISAAEKSADEVINKARRQAQAQTTEAIERATEKAELSKQLAMGSAEHIENEAALAAKNELITRVLSGVARKLCDMPLPELFSFIERRAVESARKGECTIFFSQKDRERIPQAFIDSLNQNLAKKGTVVTVSSQPRNIDGGFIMSYGDIEENCSFEAIIASEREKLSDIANHELFN